MIFALITLAIVGLVLFILSFFTHDKIKDLEDQIEDVSITSLQESYRLKNKMKVLEEELLTDPAFTENMDMPSPSSEENQPAIYDQIKKLYDVGFSIDQIANSTDLKVHDVRAIIHQLYPGEMEQQEGEA
ncbi:hypothetical protein SAMN05421676_106118 [Salinibacillus kushneri]|uniref:Uncharacterized protein n=1 Tax=Salinibacillus kushneri TaxID=237682 RepID=A0A1I0FYW8_9BACI|nr:hypothetical protein [Salinibacillus kushneri]SET62734.1 hypothetical protein SAMN05421676_106118 [Salinibacillus kushneri]